MLQTWLLRIFPFLGWMRQVNAQTLRADFSAGLTGAVIVLPQGVAFATIAGLPPEYGLYTAMVTPIIAALFGSSNHLVSGPTTAISLVVFSAISQHATPGTPEFVQLALTLTFLAGVYQLAFGLARLGVLVNFVSHTVVIAFTAGAAILIGASQLKYVLGLDIERSHSFASSIIALVQHLGETNGYVLAIALITMVTALYARRISRKMPHLLLGLIAGAIIALVLASFSSGIRFVSAIPGQLPPLSAPQLTFDTLHMLASQAFAVALLGLIEAVSIARSIATRSQQRIHGSQEFVGQGLSNIAGSFFSSYAGSGSFTRSGINYDAGAKTPLSAIFAALVLGLVVLLVAPLASYLPIAAMGGVILLVAYNLIDFHHIKEVFHTSRAESAIFVVTFLSTLFLELEFAIYLGVILSLVIFLAKTSRPNIVALAPDSRDVRRHLTSVDSNPLAECPQLKIVRVDRSLYFGSVNYIQTRLQEIEAQEGINRILLVATRINYIDMAGAEMLVQEAKRLQQHGGGLYVVGLKPELWQFLAEGGFLKKIGAQHFFDNKADAITAIYSHVEKSVCSNCTKKIFVECGAQRQGGTIAPRSPAANEAPEVSAVMP